MFTFKKDQYSNIRGGYSALLDIRCQYCGNHICFYQKDGPGELRRMYCDRIVSPKELVEKIKVENFNELNPLQCNNCNRVIAMPIIYEQENRFALRLFVGAIKKTKITLKDYNKSIKA